VQIDGMKAERWNGVNGEWGAEGRDMWFPSELHPLLNIPFYKTAGLLAELGGGGLGLGVLSYEVLRWCGTDLTTRRSLTRFSLVYLHLLFLQGTAA
jgi:hypothetical protein